MTAWPCSFVSIRFLPRLHDGQFLLVLVDFLLMLGKLRLLLLDFLLMLGKLLLILLLFCFRPDQGFLVEFFIIRGGR